MTVEVDPSLADDVLIAEFGWWEGNPDLGLPALDALSASGSNYNTMITTAVADPVSGSIPFRSIPCTIGPAASPDNMGRQAALHRDGAAHADQ